MVKSLGLRERSSSSGKVFFFWGGGIGIWGS